MRTAAVAFILSMLCRDAADAARPAAGAPVRRARSRADRRARSTASRSPGSAASRSSSRSTPRSSRCCCFRRGVGQLFLAEREHVIGLFVGGLAIALLGPLRRPARAPTPGRSSSSSSRSPGCMYSLGFRIDAARQPVRRPIALGVARRFRSRMFWIVGVINAMNLIDGLDGLAGGVALVAVDTTFCVSLQRGHPLMMLFSSRARRRDPRVPLLQLQPGVDLHGRHREHVPRASCWRRPPSRPTRRPRPPSRC